MLEKESRRFSFFEPKGKHMGGGGGGGGGGMMVVEKKERVSLGPEALRGSYQSKSHEVSKKAGHRSKVQTRHVIPMHFGRSAALPCVHNLCFY